MEVEKEVKRRGRKKGAVQLTPYEYRAIAAAKREANIELKNKHIIYKTVYYLQYYPLTSSFDGVLLYFARLKLTKPDRYEVVKDIHMDCLKAGEDGYSEVLDNYIKNIRAKNDIPNENQKN